MIRSVSVTAVAVLGLGLVAAAPASAASDGPPAGIGYVASPKALHSVSVIVKAPALHCTTSSPAGAVQLGLFTHVRAKDKTSQVSLTVDASCRGGAAHYSASYRGAGGSGGVHITHGDRVMLKLSGPGGSSFSIDNLTTGEGEGGGASGGPGPGPRTERRVLIGARHTGHAPSLLTTFEGAKVNGRPLADVVHRRTDKARVTALRGSDFHVRFGPR